jgi:hypothetical protein
MLCVAIYVKISACYAIAIYATRSISACYAIAIYAARLISIFYAITISFKVPPAIAVVAA